MRRVTLMVLIALSLLSGCAAGDTETSAQADDRGTEGSVPVKVNEEAQGMTIKLDIGERRFTATLASNSSADALIDLLAHGPVTIDMQDYGNMEKVGRLGTNLPTNDEQITTKPGDLILYMGDSFVIYYAPNSWNFTKLGSIDDVTELELKEALGDGDVTVVLSLD